MDESHKYGSKSKNWRIFELNTIYKVEERKTSILLRETYILKM